MEKSELRLELLKLTHHHGLSQEVVTGRAKFYEAFVSELGEDANESEAKADKAKALDKRQKKSGNLDSLV